MMSLLETKKKWLNIWEEWERVTLLILIFIKLGKVNGKYISELIWEKGEESNSY